MVRGPLKPAPKYYGYCAVISEAKLHQDTAETTQSIMLGGLEVFRKMKVKIRNTKLVNCLNMRTTIVLTLACLLISCESGLETCMNAELPKAEAIFELEAEREAGRQLTALGDLNRKIDAIAGGMKVFKEKNPYPADRPILNLPENTCSELHDDYDAATYCYDRLKNLEKETIKMHERAEQEWRSSPKVVAWNALAEAVELRLAHANELHVESLNELYSIHDQVYLQMESLVKPRSSIWPCTDDGDCDGGGFSKAIAEAMVNNANELSELIEQSKELATVTCNNNGFYE